uniref:Uncharacterized protein n=1 Tax=Pithovirus LCPAC103 TaxID=2506588 RepID=A0A481Z4I4_9VIRU|nr:MAG: hypothetical protein LCPAC103_01770 [Pithovirus LCPAC103]
MEFEALATKIPAKQTLTRGVDPGRSLHIDVESGTAEFTLHKFRDYPMLGVTKILKIGALIVINAGYIVTIHNPDDNDLIISEKLSLG